MRKITGIILLFVFALQARADHITGGEMYYSFAGFSAGEYKYDVTLKFFMRCNSGRQFSNPTIVSVFEKGSLTRIKDISVPLSSQETISLTSTNPCISDPPIVCYEVGYYHFTVSLPASANGYIMASQVNYRISGINNLALGYSQIGATYTAEIPGNATGATVPENHSANFVGSDLVIVCAENSFTYSFAAKDNDGDILRYSFCDAYVSGIAGGGPGGSQPPPPPPYQPVPYAYPDFSGNSPLGGNVQINTTTGLITGIAPAEGVYVVTVCVEEIRGGKVIATQRKDLQIKIAPCTIAAATIPPAYMLCGDTKTINLVNNSNSPLITSYNWELINAAGVVIHASANATVTYTFADTGTYSIKLVINRGQQCSDSATSVARVYPGFVPAFNFTGICFAKPTKFIDATTSVYGTVNNWQWDFGEVFSTLDFSDQQHPVYTYGEMGTKMVRLIAGNSVGCLDTIYKNLTIVDKPPIALAFRDTLICNSDRLQLQASGSGNFSWTPAVNIINANTATPTVSPTVTTTYYVDMNDNGCLNRDSVKVRVVNFVTLQAMADTVICQGDAIQLHLASDGLRYIWTPAAQLNNAGIANPVAVTPFTTLYGVTAIIGSCSARDEVLVTTVAYPIVNAGADTTICFSTVAQLNGSTNGNIVAWSPVTTLSNATLLNPQAKPVGTTQYILAAYDNKGCPKPARDSMQVIVLPDIVASAGRDTTVVVGQPLQLTASGGIKYNWLPAFDLSAANIANPVAIYKTAAQAIQYKVIVYNEAGCVDSAYVTVKVFKTRPAVFVPNAFTPNGDNHNDVLKPIAAGIKQLEYFNVYNRWGQLVFSTTSVLYGWNGNFAGKQQANDTFVWMVKAIDYTGATYFQKGIVMLIR